MTTNNEDKLPKTWADNRVWRYLVYFVEVSGVYVTLRGWEPDDGKFNCGFHLGPSGFDLEVFPSTVVQGRVIAWRKLRLHRELEINLGWFMFLTVGLGW